MEFYFYDLETSGRSPRSARVMQFAGQRLDSKLKPIGEPDNLMIKLHADVVPEPEAILITGITPQAVEMDGLTEVAFLQYFHKEILKPNMVIAGFNSVRFDDEFMRFMQYRNYFDAYEWQWQDQRSRWDLLDVIRMTRALRPEGINWPITEDGKPTNRLELLTKINGLAHDHAHDALSDVYATIEIARMISNKQPKLYDYLLSMRDKRKVADFVQANKMFVYTSGKYSNEHEKTTIVSVLGSHPRKQGALVYDLRHDPTAWFDKTAEQLAAAWRYNPDPDAPRLPVKTMQFNRCPAVAPLGVLDDAAKDRLHIDLTSIQKHASLLKKDPSFMDRILEALTLLDAEQEQTWPKESPADQRLYDDFISDADRTKMRVVRALSQPEIASYVPDFTDRRLIELWPFYKARNFPQLLSEQERKAWDAHVATVLMGDGPEGLRAFFMKLEKLAQENATDSEKIYLLEELQLYGQALMPAD